MTSLRLLLLIGLLGGSVPAWAGNGGFTATLAGSQFTAAGLDSLNDDQRVSLDRLIATELAQARQHPDQPLAGTFSTRRTTAEHEQAGLDLLSSAELAKLDDLIAEAIAARPKPKERPRLKESDVLAAARKPEIHGSVSVAYGRGAGGRNFRATSLAMNYYDPERRFSLGVGISTGSGDFFPGYAYTGYDDPLYHRPWGYYADDYGYWSEPSDYFYRPDLSVGWTRPMRGCRRW